MTQPPYFSTVRSCLPICQRSVGIRLLFAVVLIATTAACRPGTTNEPKLASVEIAYCFSDGKTGGVAITRIDKSTGQISPPERLLDSKDCADPKKVRRAPDGSFAVTNLKKKGPHLFLVSRDRSQDATPINLASVPDEVRITDKGLAFITCEEDAVAVVHLDRKRVTRMLQMDEMLMPPANKPEDVHITADQRFALVSFQKDGSGGKKLGNRVTVFDLEGLGLIADLPIPRDHPELHLPDNAKAQGPGPEVVRVAKSSNTLIVSLDLYGAIGLANWDDAQQGKLRDWRIVSTSPTGELGTAFPDRMTLINVHGRDYLLVCNAGTTGGACLVDIADQRVKWKRDTPPGLEAPVFYPSLRQAFSVCSGKTKKRVGNEVEKTTDPQTNLYILDLSSPLESEAPIIEVPLEIHTVQITSVSESPPLLLIAGGTTDGHANQLLTFDPVTRKIKDRLTVEENIIRFER